jgi:hypothetical protein
MHFKKKFEISWSGLREIMILGSHVCLCGSGYANFG